MEIWIFAKSNSFIYDQDKGSYLNKIYEIIISYSMNTSTPYTDRGMDTLG